MTATKMRTHVKDFTIHIGSLTFRGKLTSVQRPQPKGKGDGSYKLCSPNGEKVKQVYQDDGGKIFEKDQLRRYIPGDDDEIKMISEDAVAAAKQSQLPSNIMTVTVHSAADVDGELFPTSEKNSYLFEADAADAHNTQINDLVVKVLEKGKVALLANVNVRGHDGFYRLIVWRGNLIIQPQIYTDALNPHPDREFKVKKDVVDKGQELFEKLTVSFDADTYVNTTLDRIRAAEAIEAGATDAAKVIEKVTAAQPEADLLSVLDSALETA